MTGLLIDQIKIHMNRRLRCAREVMVTLKIMILLASCAAPMLPDGPFVEYSLTGQSARIVTAATPFDSNLKAREAFLHWFERGLETVLSGKQPIMVEWQDSPAGRAGQQGYDIGMQEGESFLKDRKGHDQPLQITRVVHLR